MLRWKLIIVVVLALVGNMQAAVIFESQERSMTLVAQAGPSQVQLNGSSMDFSPLILGQSIKALGPGCQVQVVGSHISAITPGSIYYDYNPSLLAGSGTGTPVVDLFASYHTLLNVVFSVTDSPLDFNISHSFYGGNFHITNVESSQVVADLNSPSTVILQPGRYCLYAEFGISKLSRSNEPFYMDFEGLSSLRVNYDAATTFLPEPSTLIIFSILSGLGIFFGWRNRRCA